MPAVAAAQGSTDSYTGNGGIVKAEGEPEL